MQSRRHWFLSVLACIALANGAMSVLTCPGDNLPYSCTKCLRITPASTDQMTFSDASTVCSSSNSTLVQVEGSTQKDIIRRFIASLNLTSDKLWVGYRYTADGVVVSTDGDPAPDIVVPPPTLVTPDETVCVAVEGGGFVSTPCSDRLGYICSYTRGVPEVTSDDGDMIRYILRSHSSTFSVSLASMNGITDAEWHLNGTPLSNDDSNHFSISDFPTISLTLMDFDPTQHSGQLELLLVTFLGPAVVAVWELQEPVLGEITTNPRNLTIPYGKIALFECAAADSVPKATITWYKDSVRLSPNDNLSEGTGSVMGFSDFTGTLFIREVEKSDEGLYHCTAENARGTLTSQTAVLTVDSFTVEGNRFLLSPHSLTVLAGTTYSAECVGLQTSTATDVYTMHKMVPLDMDFEVLNGPKSFPANRGFPAFSFGAEVEHNGSMLLCSFGGEVGPGVSHTFSDKAWVTVHAPPKLTDLSTVLQGRRRASPQQALPVGSLPQLMCQFSGSPSPTVTWSKNGVEITKGVSSPESGYSSLDVGAFSSGIYQCAVSNMYSTELGTLTLCSADSTPSEVVFSATPDSLTSIFVQWSPPASPNTHPLLLEYRVAYYETDERLSSVPILFSPNLPSGMMEYVIRGLTLGATYRVKVEASSVVGISTAAPDPVTTTTYQPAPSAPVDSLSVFIGGSGESLSLTVAWELSSLPPFLVGYSVEYRSINGTHNGTRFVNGSVSAVIMTGLLDNGQYEARVRLTVQTQRHPIQLDFSPWSEWQEAEETPPSMTTDGVRERGIPMENLLLIIVLVPVAVFVVLLVLIIVFVLAGLWWCKHRPDGIYWPSKEESGERKRPMGNQIFDLYRDDAQLQQSGSGDHTFAASQASGSPIDKIDLSTLEDDTYYKDNVIDSPCFDDASPKALITTRLSSTASPVEQPDSYDYDMPYDAFDSDTLRVANHKLDVCFEASSADSAVQNLASNGGDVTLQSYAPSGDSMVQSHSVSRSLEVIGNVQRGVVGESRPLSAGSTTSRDTRASKKSVTFEDPVHSYSALSNSLES